MVIVSEIINLVVRPGEDQKSVSQNGKHLMGSRLIVGVISILSPIT